jgi:hypothetical protein
LSVTRKQPAQPIISGAFWLSLNGKEKGDGGKHDRNPHQSQKTIHVGEHSLPIYLAIEKGECTHGGVGA